MEELAPRHGVPITLLFPFDLGHTYLVPANVQWGVECPAVQSEKRFKSINTLFPKEIQPPFREPLVYVWEELSKFDSVLPWCQVVSARFCLTLEGIALLIVQGQLKVNLADLPSVEEGWWKNGQELKQMEQEVISAAAAMFDAVAAQAKLTRTLERDGKRTIPWLYYVTHSTDPSPYSDPRVSDHPFRGSKLTVAWRGAHVRYDGMTLGPQREDIDSVFAACSLSWQSLLVLDTVLSTALQNSVLSPYSEELEKAQKLRDVHLYSGYLLSSTNALRWTIREALLKAIEVVFKAWDVKNLTDSVLGQADLVATHSRQTEQQRMERAAEERKAKAAELAEAAKQRENEEKAAADAAKKRAENLDFQLKLVGLILAAASLVSAATNFIILLHKSEYKDKSEWRYDFALTPVAFALLVVLPLAFWFWNARKRHQS